MNTLAWLITGALVLVAGLVWFAIWISALPTQKSLRELADDEMDTVGTDSWPAPMHGGHAHFIRQMEKE